FDPMRLPGEVRQQLQTAGIAAISNGFADRLRSDAAALSGFRARLEDNTQGPAPLEEIRAIAHALAGASGIFGCEKIGDGAAKVEEATARRLRGENHPGEVERQLDSLLLDIANK